ncbi:polysaccharide pyruvyl transferase family protein, partial [Neobacillus niacini]|uniref:polysaccharide pyruvyl transferase family protein n=1 Tax=Neobacillus niacini TaxID=86668 RepID=UPI002FFEF0BE
MKNIVMFGLKYDENIGDPVIVDCMEYFSNKIVSNVSNKNIEIVSADMSGRTEFILTRSLTQKIIDKLLRVFIPNQKRKIEINNARKGALNAVLSNINNETLAIVFAGGGLIKYKQQLCHHYIDVITEYADKHNIPVMISGAGVEGYDELNRECQMLKRALRRSCVKVITTRDDLSLLTEFYCENTNIRTAQVADPACSINSIYPEFYKKKPSNYLNKNKMCIGIGVGRSNLFADYGINISEQQLLTFYKELVHELENKGYDWKIFTNGLNYDQRFAEKIVSYLGKSECDNVLIKKPSNIEELLEIINNFDATIVCRLHASIISYSYDIPTLGLVWNNKQKMFGESIGHPERFLDMKNLSAKTVVNIMENAITQGYNKADKEKYCDTTFELLKEFFVKHIIT